MPRSEPGWLDSHAPWVGDPNFWGKVRHCSTPSQPEPLPTSADEADGTEQPSFRVIHLQGQQLVGEGEDQVCERPEASVVHLGPIERQPVGEGHGVLFGRVPRADPQDLGAEDG